MTGTYKDTPLYVLTIANKTGKNSQINKTYLYIRKINPEYYHYYIATFEEEDSVFIEKDSPYINGNHIEEYRRWKLNTENSIYFTDLNLCRKLLKEKKIKNVDFNKIEFIDEVKED